MGKKVGNETIKRMTKKERRKYEEEEKTAIKTGTDDKE